MVDPCRESHAGWSRRALSREPTIPKFFLEKSFHRIFHSGHEVTTDTGGPSGGAGGREFSGRE
jgi:hypothetical protein